MDPLPFAMKIEEGEGGHIKGLENLFKNANFEQDNICYDNSFITDVIGSRKEYMYERKTTQGSQHYSLQTDLWWICFHQLQIWICQKTWSKDFLLSQENNSTKKEIILNIVLIEEIVFLFLPLNLKLKN